MSNKLSSEQKSFLQTHFTVSISVIHSSSGYPIIFPARIAEIEGKLYFSTIKDSKKVKHLNDNHKIGVNITDVKGYPYLSISGDVVILKQSDESFSPLNRKIFEKYNPDGSMQDRNSTQEDPERVLIEITPRYIYGGVK